MVRLQRVLESLVRRVANWSAERSALFASLPDNPWTYPGCGVHVKASDFFQRGQLYDGLGSFLKRRGLVGSDRLDLDFWRLLSQGFYLAMQELEPLQ